MVTVIICTGVPEERTELPRAFHDLAARLTEDRWDIRTPANIKEAESVLKAAPLVDLFCCEAADMDGLVRLRSLCKESRLLVIAEETLSPLAYLRPQIMASSLLMRPYKRKELYSILREFVEAYLDDRPDEGENIVVKTREGHTIIPCKKIYYLEAREKKIFIRLLSEEYAIAETLDNLMQKLAGQLIRVHRSFAVNPGRIRQVKLSEGLIMLQDGFQIPLSRSYKAEMKGFLG